MTVFLTFIVLMVILLARGSTGPLMMKLRILAFFTAVGRRIGRRVIRRVHSFRAKNVVGLE